MVIIFKRDTKETERVEHNVMAPTIPANMTFEEQKAHYRKEGLDFIVIPQEMGHYIFDYDLRFDEEDNFIGLQPKTQKE